MSCKFKILLAIQHGMKPLKHAFANSTISSNSLSYIGYMKNNRRITVRQKYYLHVFGVFDGKFTVKT